MLTLLSIVFIMSWSLTWCVKRYALAKDILDIPNHRSSHKKPIPRGGGVAFVSVFLVVMGCLCYLNILHYEYEYGLIGAVLLIAAIGFFDDKYSITAGVRIIGHFAACILAVYSMGGLPGITIYSWVLQPGYLANILAIIYLVWMLNLYNFMDGIDGLAGIEAISVCIGACFLYYLTGNLAYTGIPLILSAAIAGFLFWNFPPARIFMGDAGSGFLGFVLGLLSIQSISLHPSFFWSWLILLGVFIVDATITLFVRLSKGEKVYMAHCSHAYQHASRLFKNHKSITLGILVLNILWLWPLAIFVGLDYLNGFIGLLIAYIPLSIIAFQLNAGK